jgi:1-pyrroline-4-hydroxy-2-carboxylate deaminase
MARSSIFTGVVPALMTPVGADGAPDFAPMVRKATELLGAGMSAVVYCGSMGDWPLLTDEERMAGVDALVKADIPVIVGTGAQNTKRAVALAAHGRKVGAKGLMIIPRVLSRGSSVAAQKAHFEAILEAGAGLPAVIYNSPYYGFETKADLFFEVRKKHPNLVGFKEFGGAAPLSYAAQHIAGADADVALTVGVDTAVFHGYVNCGAVGAITGIGNVLPKPVLQLVALCQKAAKGDAKARVQALQLEAALGVLSSFDEGVDLVLYYKYLMLLEGNPEYERHFNASDMLSASQRRYAEDQLKLFKTWYADWSRSNG